MHTIKYANIAKNPETDHSVIMQSKVLPPTCCLTSTSGNSATTGGVTASDAAEAVEETAAGTGDLDMRSSERAADLGRRRPRTVRLDWPSRLQKECLLRVLEECEGLSLRAGQGRKAGYMKFKIMFFHQPFRQSLCCCLHIGHFLLRLSLNAQIRPMNLFLSIRNSS